MADQRITELAALLGAGVASTDPLVIVDVSDTSMAPTGTDKKITAGELGLAIQALLGLAVAADLVTLAPATSVRNVITPTGDATALTLKSFAGQTEPLAVWKDENGNVILNLGPDGTLTPHLFGVIGQYSDAVAAYFGDPGFVDPAVGDDSQGWLTMVVGGNEPDSVAMAFGYGNPAESLTEWVVTETQAAQTFTFSDGTIHIKCEPDRARINIQPATGQAGPCFSLGDGSTSRPWCVLPLGAVGTKGTEPADSDIQNGECFRWFDPTAGAPLIKFKMKDANGDVFTASIPGTPA